MSVFSTVSVIVLSSLTHLPCAVVPSTSIVTFPPLFNSIVNPVTSSPESVIPKAVPLTAIYFPVKASSALPEDPPQAVTDRQSIIAIKIEISFFIVVLSLMLV